MPITLLSFESKTHLSGPPTSLPEILGTGGVTGGGLVALVEAERGIRALWRGSKALTAQGIELSLEGALLLGEALRIGHGSWERRIPLSSGEILLERGLLPEVGGGLVVQWHLLVPEIPSPEKIQNAHYQLTVRGRGTGDPESQLTVRLEVTSPVTVLITEAGRKEEGSRLLGQLRGRELQRVNRSPSLDSHSLCILVQQEVDPGVEEALLAIDNAALLVEEGVVPQSFLAGIDGGEPRLLKGSNLAELGVAALLSGKRGLAKGVLEALSQEESPPALPFLDLATRWAFWTGDPRLLLSLRPALDQAIGALDLSAPSASLPSSPSVLRDFIAGIEPLGDEGWERILKTRLAELEESRRPPQRRVLPVFGSDGGRTTSTENSSLEKAEREESAPRLPLPSSFASPVHPGVRAQQTLQGARILRAWIEGVLGTKPDIRYGRIRIGPAIQTGWRCFEARGVRAGDVLLTLRYEIEPTGCSFILLQEEGRVPVNLIFEPLLPFTEVHEVRIDDEPAKIEIQPEEGGIRLRCQLPLDGERRIQVVGLTSEPASSPF